jgi:hypothetical protein
MEVDMQLALNRQTALVSRSVRSVRHLAWLLSLLLLISFALTDAAVVALCAGLATGSEMAAGAMTFGLVSLGLIVTMWELDR